MTSLAHPIFTIRPELQQQWQPLLTQRTPVARFASFGQEIGHANLYVKREDLTSPGYGGNKVRNLEFLLGRAQFLGFHRVAMVAPLGSNFVAATAAQTQRIGMSCEFFQFVPTTNPQVEMHAHFSETMGARVHRFDGPFTTGILKSAAGLTLRLSQNLWSKERTLRLPVGGSDGIGALGQVNAALELATQIKVGEIPEPDFLVVGVGTCGTMAGLIVGLRIAGLKTKVVGVRCVDRIVCNPGRIAKLANKLAMKLSLRIRFTSADVVLQDYNHYDVASSSFAYAKPLDNAAWLVSEMLSLENITLDTTYTTKVIHFLKNWVQQDPFQTCKRTILYWHTFSPAALQVSKAAPSTTSAASVNLCNTSW